MLRPGGNLATRPLDFIFVVDTSASMSSGGKIEALNEAILNAIPFMRDVADENPNATIRVRVLDFSTGARWHVKEPTPVSDFEWVDLKASGVTDMGEAFDMLSEVLDVKNMPERALPPVLVLISDGQPTDDYKPKLEKLLSMPWGVKSVKLAIGIGSSVNERVLNSFINNDSIDIMKAHNSHKLVEYIKWASTVVLQAASSPSTKLDDDVENFKGNVMLPAIPIDFGFENIDIEDVW